MKNRIPCGIIRDLLPNYIEGLTSEVTNEEIKEHVGECQDCRSILDAMTQKDEFEENEPASEVEKEIDFLKKAKKKNSHAIIIGIAAIVLALAWVVTSVCFLNDRLLKDVECNSVYLINENTVRIAGLAGEGRGFKHLEVAEQNGILQVSFVGTRRALFYKEAFDEEYEAEGKIKEVWINDRIVWADGRAISYVTAALYNTRHPYVGEHVENGKTCRVLNMYEFMGASTCELQTKEEPYGMIFTLSTDFPVDRREAMERRLSLYASGLIAEIDNLSYVTYQYKMGGEPMEYKVTIDDACNIAGNDIKKVGQSPALLELFLKDTGLDELMQVSEDEAHPTVVGKDTKVEICIRTEDDIYKLAIARYVDGNCVGTTSVQEANVGPFNKGSVQNFDFIEEDFGENYKNAEKIELAFIVTTKDGKEHVIPTRMKINKEEKTPYRFSIEGSEADGYKVHND